MSTARRDKPHRLCRAILLADATAVAEILGGSRVEESDSTPCGVALLPLAISLRNVHIVRALLEHGADLESLYGDQSVQRMTLLDSIVIEAIFLDDRKNLELILDAGFDVNFEDSNGLHILDRSAVSSLDTTRYLLERVRILISAPATDGRR